MKPIALLLLISLSGCGLIHIEIRDRKPQEKRVETPKAQVRTAPTEKKEAPRGEVLKVSMPVKGKITRSERGYFIGTSCDEFFRSVSDGRVLYAGDDIRNMGWVVMVEAEDGYVYVYAKAGSSFVKKREAVRKGQPLGKVGNSGDGCGVLFEVRDKEGKPVSFELVL